MDFFKHFSAKYYPQKELDPRFETSKDIFRKFGIINQLAFGKLPSYHL